MINKNKFSKKFRVNKNKRGAEKVLSVYWFVILLLVAGGVFAMVYNFYHHPYDVREIEANLMINTVADCVSTGGKIVIIAGIPISTPGTTNLIKVEIVD